MRPLDLPILADENVHPDVIDALRREGRDIEAVSEKGLSGSVDREIIQYAHQTGRVILTHDSDFGELAFSQGIPFLGIVFFYARAIFGRGLPWVSFRRFRRGCLRSFRLSS